MLENDGAQLYSTYQEQVRTHQSPIRQRPGMYIGSLRSAGLHFLVDAVVELGLIAGDGDEICRHDVVPGLVAIIGVRLESIAYGDNVHGRLANPEVRPQAMWLVERHLGASFATRAEQARKVIQTCLTRRRYMDSIPAGTSRPRQRPRL